VPAERFTDWPSVTHLNQKYGGVTDRHWILPTSLVERALNVTVDVVSRTSIWTKRILSIKLNLERALHYHLLEHEIPFRFYKHPAFTVRHYMDSYSRSKGSVYLPRVHAYIKYKSEAVHACRSCAHEQASVISFVSTTTTDERVCLQICGRRNLTQPACAGR